MKMPFSFVGDTLMISFERSEQTLGASLYDENCSFSDELYQ